MKIAFIVYDFPKLSETFILNQITGLIDLSHHIYIYARTRPEEAKVHAGMVQYNLMDRVQYFPRFPQNPVLRVLKAIFLVFLNFHRGPVKILKALNCFKYGKRAFTLKLLYDVIPFLDNKFDIIHSHFGPNGISGMYLKELGVSAACITSFHGHDVNSYPLKTSKNVYENLFRNGDLMIANSNFTKQQLIKLGCREEKIVCLPVGFKVDQFRCPDRGKSNKKFIKILTVGRLLEKKGQEFGIKAIARLVPHYDNLQYILAGDGPLKAYLEDLVLQLKIQNYVKFLGSLNFDEVLNLYREADIFILPCVTARNGDREGQALVLQEAQAMGLPVISTLHNGIPESITEGKSGFLVPERDVNALADKIEYLINNSNLWSEMGRLGRSFVIEKYDILKLNKQLEKIYENLLAK